MKLKTKMLIILPYVFLCLCSFTNNPGSIYVEWHSFTNYISIDKNGNRSEEKSGAGHSFVVFKNNTRKNMNIGYKTIYPGGYLSVGLWNGVSAGSSSSGSNSSSGSSNASSVSHSGVYYDLERYYYTRFENMRNDVYATCTLTSDEKLKKLTDLLKKMIPITWHFTIAQIFQLIFGILSMTPTTMGLLKARPVIGNKL